MSESIPEPTDNPTENAADNAAGDDETTEAQLPGNRSEGADSDPLDAAEAEGGEVGAG